MMEDMTEDDEMEDDAPCILCGKSINDTSYTDFCDHCGYKMEQLLKDAREAGLSMRFGSGFRMALVGVFGEDGEFGDFRKAIDDRPA